MHPILADSVPQRRRSIAVAAAALAVAATLAGMASHHRGQRHRHHPARVMFRVGACGQPHTSYVFVVR
jgi:hypothetical protein